MKKMLEVRQTVNTTLHVTTATMCIGAYQDVYLSVLNSFCVI